MNFLNIAWKNIRYYPTTAILGILLTALGTGILCVLLLTAHQVEDQLGKNSKGIDLVVGAKGSPIQLILSSIYHMDNPTGNINYREARTLTNHPMVRLAVPLSLGDNFKGHRIVGTDSSFLSLYRLSLAEGDVWQENFEATIGAEVAAKHRLKIGDEIHGAHGLSADGYVHDEHPYVITGIFEPTNTIADKLILTNLESVWLIHETPDEAKQQPPGDAKAGELGHRDEATDTDNLETTEGEEAGLVKEKPQLVKNLFGDIGDGEREITSMLIRYANPAAIGLFPRMVNQNTTMQAASPALESARLFNMLGVGIDSLEILGYIIMMMAAISIFVSLYNSLKNRKYDLAIMRTLGASQIKLFGIVIAEGMLITGFGAIVGIIFGHIAIHWINLSIGTANSWTEMFRWLPQEGWLIFTGVVIGLVAAIIPAWKAYRTPISKTLSNS